MTKNKDNSAVKLLLIFIIFVQFQVSVASANTNPPTPTGPFAANCAPDDKCCLRRLDAMNKHSNTALAINNATVANPNPSLMQSCVGSLSSLGNLSFPSLSNILGQLQNTVCQQIKSEVSSVVGGMQYSFQVGSFSGVNLGGVTLGVNNSGAAATSSSSSTTSVGGLPVNINTTPIPVSIPSTVGGAMQSIK